MKTFITGVSLALLVGCSPADPERDSEGRYIADSFHAEVCLKGVVYYSGQYRLTPKFKPDSTVETCN
jgi:hypothetical protein